MEANTKKRRMRKVSSWMSDAARSINNEEGILAGKRIVLKVLRYMESKHMSQKDLAEKLGVSPQYINKFLHGQECDIKVSTAIRYGNILGLKLIEIPDSAYHIPNIQTVMYKINIVTTYKPQYYTYNHVDTQPFKQIN
ncbi:MAG: helix-turn-helix transcriptional regulator [Bacteroidetes bacterium]|uniref:Helix-turn-helix transcriptional regulator n=1 Tax=Candidatus Cryptobacteroides avicola TaxID=2840757 RepID=A0A940DT05_9BACT|nr:helix-turn-helix transcriptional regulator [Candidatus Cryptobacteroides avicola]